MAVIFIASLILFWLVYFQGRAARDIVLRLEKWVHNNNASELGVLNDQSRVESALSFVEDIIDEIDDLNQGIQPQKDIITVSESQYNDSFPAFAEVHNENVALQEIVLNPSFADVPELLKKHSVKQPVILTSVRKSSVANQLQYGKQYIVDSCCKDGVKIHYEHEGSGDTPIAAQVIEILFGVMRKFQDQVSTLNEVILCEK